MTLDDYRSDLRERNGRRTAGPISSRVLGCHAYQARAVGFDACITLAAPREPIGLGSTGDPTFASPVSMLGVPAITLPVLKTTAYR